MRQVGCCESGNTGGVLGLIRGSGNIEITCRGINRAEVPLTERTEAVILMAILDSLGMRDLVFFTKSKNLSGCMAPNYPLSPVFREKSLSFDAWRREGLWWQCMLHAVVSIRFSCSRQKNRRFYDCSRTWMLLSKLGRCLLPATVG